MTDPTPTEAELGAALVNAHNAGDEDAARTLASAIVQMRASATPVAGSSMANPIDDTAHAAGAGTIARASLAPDPQVQIKRYAEAFNQPVTDFGIINGHIVRHIPETGQFARVEPSVTGGSDPIDTAKRLGDWIAGGAGQAIPAVASGLGAGGAALLAAPSGPGAIAAAVGGGAAGAAGGEALRQKLDHMLAPDNDVTKYDVGNIGWQGAAGAAGPIIGKGIEAVGSRIAPLVDRGIEAAGNRLSPLFVDAATQDALDSAASTSAPTATATTPASSYGLHPDVIQSLQDHIQGQADKLQRLIDAAKEFGFTPSLGQITDSAPVQVAERQSARQIPLMQKFANLADAQNKEQLPGAVKIMLDDIAPDASPGEQVAAFRGAAQDVIDQGLKARSDLSRPLYEQALQGRSIAPLEDQFSAFSSAVDSARDQLAKATDAASLSTGGGNSGKLVADAQAKLESALAAQSQAKQVLQRAQADGTANAQGAVWSPRIQEFLDDPVMQAGLKRGMEIQRLESLAEGRPFNMTDFAITGTDKDGNPIVGAVPNMRTLDAGKKGLDAIIKDNTNDFGQMNQYANAVNKVRKAYLGEVDSLNPDYAPARAQWGSDTDTLNAIRDGGVGFLNSMSGPDRQNMISRVFSGQNITNDGLNAMRQKFIDSGHLDDWNGAVRNYLANTFSMASKSVQQGGDPVNVGGKMYAALWGDPNQKAVIETALGGANTPLAQRWNRLGDVMQMASRRLPEGSATATDTGAPALTSGGLFGAAKALLGGSGKGVADNVMAGLTEMQKRGNAQKFVNYALNTDEGAKMLRALSVVPTDSPKARSILGTMFTQAGIVGTEDAAAGK